MGVLDKLMFWRTKTVDFETDIEGCFTLPGAEIGDPVQPLTENGDACEMPTAKVVDAAEASDALSDESGR